MSLNGERIEHPAHDYGRTGFYELPVGDYPGMLSQLASGKGALLDHVGSLSDRVAFVPPRFVDAFVPSLYLLTNYDDIRAVWVQHSDDLDKTGALYDATRRFAGEGLFTMRSGTEWKQRQRIIGRHVIPHRIDNLDQQVEAITTESFAQYLAGTSESEDIHSIIKTISFQITAQLLLGYSATSKEALSVADSLTTINQFVANSTQLAGIPERIHRHLPMYPAIYAAEKTLHTFANRMMEIADSPLMQTMRSQDVSHQGILTEQNIHDEIITILAAGHGTTASAITWALHLVSLPEHRHYQEDISSRGPESDGLGFRVVQESLRLYPPVYVTARKATSDIHVESDRGAMHIPKDSHVVISPYLTHRDSRVWEHPLAFSPERFEGEKHASFIPFGLGERKCIGEHLALRVAAGVLSTLMAEYRFSSEKSMKPLFISTMRPEAHAQMEITRV